MVSRLYLAKLSLTILLVSDLFPLSEEGSILISKGFLNIGCLGQRLCITWSIVGSLWKYILQNRNMESAAQHKFYSAWPSSMLQLASLASSWTQTSLSLLTAMAWWLMHQLKCPFIKQFPVGRFWHSGLLGSARYSNLRYIVLTNVLDAVIDQYHSKSQLESGARSCCPCFAFAFCRSFIESFTFASFECWAAEWKVGHGFREGYHWWSCLRRFRRRLLLT